MTFVLPPSPPLPVASRSPPGHSNPASSSPASPRSPTGLSSPLIPSTTGNQRILVTGAAGFIGFHTSVALLERGEDVVVVDELNDCCDVKLKESNLDDLVAKYSAERVKIYIGDLCDQALVRKVVRETQPAAVIHLAARAGVRPSIDNPLLYIHSNVTATTVLLEACRRFHIRKFVYGGSTNSSFSEVDVVDFPVSPYAATKKSCELLAHTYHHLYRIECIGLRFFTVYGPRGRPDMAPFKFMDRIARGIPIDQYGDGTSSRDYTYVDDIVQGVLLSLDKASGCQVFNLGRGTPTNLRDFITIIERLVDKKATINLLPIQPGDVPRTCADVTKAKKLLGYEPTTPLAEGLAKTWVVSQGLRFPTGSDWKCGYQDQTKVVGLHFAVSRIP